MNTNLGRSRAGVATFLSYSHEDKALAGKIKKRMGRYGFDGFLAHDDIDPSLVWQREILRQLKKCAVFVALLTNAFDKSHWTHQEVGIAYGRQKPRRPIMVPLNAGRNPTGFLANHQAISLDPEDIDNAVWRVVRSIASRKANLASRVRKSLITRAKKTNTYDDAGWLLSKLAAFDVMTSGEINALLGVATTNDQIYNSGSASRPLRSLIRKHRQKIKRGVLKQFYGVWAYKP